MQHRPDHEVKHEAPEPSVVDLEPIDVLTRAEMLAHGDLIAVPRDIAFPAGFRAPVAVTRAAWLTVVTHPDADLIPAPDDINRPLTVHERQQLHKLCHRAVFTLAVQSRADLQAPEMEFTFADQPLWLHVGPDDEDEKCFTIMTGEDR
ncbi:hypothetical protein AGRA3207_000191 [Actinomadura graeca]|uniref:Uncharacterized protein n=1 Tax=Actinomadura graeca TaxID=2750812 RepID=A0ABX8QP02_9ACTN|nr:hypothetical protein [Actinomadura graeca]QXJ19629.1 hypothetical protein AGRA3207_000191 [Actinomadura graeca]